MQIPQALPQLLPLALRKQNQLLIYKAKQGERILFWADFPYVGEHSTRVKEMDSEFQF